MTVLNVWFLVQLVTNWGWLIYTETTDEIIPRQVKIVVPLLQLVMAMAYLYCLIFVKI